MKVSFELTMPNRASWNGKWSGDERKHYIVHSLNTKLFTKVMGKETRQSWYYSFGDGWGASVVAEVISDQEARKRKRLSKGFCGYDWMVDSILSWGEILNDNQRKERIIANEIKQPL